MRRPDFFIVGAPRCGTTALYKYLRAHPDVFMPLRKEPVYFGADLTKREPLLDEEGYLRLFEPAGDAKRVGEATVWYLYSQTAPHEIKAFAPEARIIIMLRNPLDMLPSLHGLMLYAKSEDIADFAEALAAEEDRAKGHRLPPGRIRREGLMYSRLGRYAEFVERYLDVFSPGRVMVIVYDDFVADTPGTYRRALDFLEVDTSFQPRFEVVNPNKRARSELLQTFLRSLRFRRMTEALPLGAGRLLSRGLARLNMAAAARPEMSEDVRRRLREQLAPDVERLSSLIGRDLTHWVASR
jgi:hypothetical protein